MLRFASNQIRNVACVGGNIITASPISDLNPMLMGLNAILTLQSSRLGERQVAARDFFLGYRRVDMHPDEVLLRVFIPFSEEFQFVVPFKQARRREDDISIVTCCLSITLRSSEHFWEVKDCCIALGGMAPTTIRALKTAGSLVGHPWERNSIQHALGVLQEELRLPETVPGGQAEYRLALSSSFLFKAFFIVTSQLTDHIQLDNTKPVPPAVSSSDISASTNFITDPKPSSRGQQSFTASQGGLHRARPVPHTPVDGERTSVGQFVQHLNADAQVTGETRYTDDMPLPPDALHACLVTSTKAHARLISVDHSVASKCDGFVAFLSHKDVTGNNHIGAVVKDEEVFVTEEVRHYGAVIGVVICKTHLQAVYAARCVQVEYEELPAIISIEDAIAADSFFPDHHLLVNGDLQTQKNEAEVNITGTGRVGGQDHFYLETNATIALPVENGFLEVYSSTQNPTKTQNFCASVCGLAASKVTAKCKRMGGAFGGKETRSVFIAVTAALAAHVLQKPVSINVERDVDMSITGQRHAFVFHYSAGCMKDGTLKYLDAQLYSNGGFSLDLSQPVMDRALLHCDNVYNWPAFRCRGSICRTNQPSHTAFRGFGAPQGMMLTEMVVHRLATVLGISAEEFRQRNFYSEGDKTPFHQPLEAFHIPRMWNDIHSIAEVESRRASIEEFNSGHQWRKRGICVLPTKFGISFTAKFMNQVGMYYYL